MSPQSAIVTVLRLSRAEARHIVGGTHLLAESGSPSSAADHLSGRIELAISLLDERSFLAGMLGTLGDQSADATPRVIELGVSEDDLALAILAVGVFATRSNPEMFEGRPIDEPEMVAMTVRRLKEALSEA
jgi:hypothetical protein